MDKLTLEIAKCNDIAKLRSVLRSCEGFITPFKLKAQAELKRLLITRINQLQKKNA